MVSSETLAANIRRALHFVWQSGPGWTVASIALVVVQGLLPLLALYLMKLLVDAVAAGLTTPDKARVFEQIVLLVALSGAVALFEALCNSVMGLVSGTQAQAVTDYVYDILHAKSIEVDLEYYENSQYYDTLHRAQQEAPSRPTRIVQNLLQIGRNGISLAAMAGLLFAFHWSVVIILCATAIPGVLVRLRSTRKMYAWRRQRTPFERQAWYFNWLLTRDQHAKEIRLLNLGPLFRRRFSDVREQLRRERHALATRRAVADLVAQVSGVCAVFGLYAFMGYRAVQGGLTLGDLVMYYQAVQRGQNYLGQLLTSLADLYENNLFLSSLYEFLNLRRKVVEPPHPRPVCRPLQTGIVFHHVSFHYPMSTRKALDDITLVIRPGEHVAFVGENGAGKTTLVKLLCRLYDPTGGSITLDGIDLRQLETAALRREISIVFQDYARYQLTARENIWLGNIDLPPDQEEHIVAAAHQAGADEVIAGLQHGYETVLGKWFEGGEELSVGEWQKLALARAFLRDAQIVVLDEPTSALDAKAEYELFQKFHQLAAGRTAILISHRLSTVRMADRIYVLEGGRIVESGTHDELVCRDGRYARLFETQAQYYR
jgi:ATP-binding cassette subfamily B protein